MRHTANLEKALQKAASLHKDQKRKGKDEVPYITHPVSVMLILSHYTDEEDILIAGLLHDTVEDTDYTFKELEKDFGSSVRALVEGVSQPENGTWLEQKKEYLKSLKSAPDGAAYVSAADKMHNFDSARRDFKESHEMMTRCFPGNLEERILGYKRIVDHLLPRIPKEMADELQVAFASYKEFIRS
ncbi:MAG: HD domain-containing protein [Candidatus Paceibacterota bacterium]